MLSSVPTSAAHSGPNCSADHCPDPLVGGPLFPAFHALCQFCPWPLLSQPTPDQLASCSLMGNSTKDWGLAVHTAMQTPDGPASLQGSGPHLGVGRSRQGKAVAAGDRAWVGRPVGPPEEAGDQTDTAAEDRAGLSPVATPAPHIEPQS